MWLLSRMWEEGPCPDIVSLNAALKACDKRWEQAFLLCTEARAQLLLLNTVSYNSLFSTLTSGQDWQHSRELYLRDEMKSTAVLPDIITYNSLMACCTRRKDWQLMLAFFVEMRASSLSPDSFSYGSALSVCDQAGNWQLALLLLEWMHMSGLQSNELIYNSALGACDAWLISSCCVLLRAPDSWKAFGGPYSSFSATAAPAIVVIECFLITSGLFA